MILGLQLRKGPVFSILLLNYLLANASLRCRFRTEGDNLPWTWITLREVAHEYKS